MEYARLDPIERQAHIGFLDIWQALRTRQNIFNYPYFREIGLTFEQRDKNEYLLTDWYPGEDIDQRDVKRAVLISNVANIDIARPIRGWIRDLELSGPHHVLFNSFYPKEKFDCIVDKNGILYFGLCPRVRWEAHICGAGNWLENVTETSE